MLRLPVGPLFFPVIVIFITCMMQLKKPPRNLKKFKLVQTFCLQNIYLSLVSCLSVLGRSCCLSVPGREAVYPAVSRPDIAWPERMSVRKMWASLDLGKDAHSEISRSVLVCARFGKMNIFSTLIWSLKKPLLNFFIQVMAVNVIYFRYLQLLPK